jgi:hypothetical protein
VAVAGSAAAAVDVEAAVVHEWAAAARGPAAVVVTAVEALALAAAIPAALPRCRDPAAEVDHLTIFLAVDAHRWDDCRRRARDRVADKLAGPAADKSHAPLKDRFRDPVEVRFRVPAAGRLLGRVAAPRVREAEISPAAGHHNATWTTS